MAQATEGVVGFEGLYALDSVGGQHKAVLPDFCPRVLGFVIRIRNQVHLHSFGAVQHDGNH